MAHQTHPIVVNEVLERAEHQCECTGHGMCGRKTHADAQRCERALPNHALIAAPAAPVLSEHEAARTAVGALRAWCTDCYARALTRLRRERQRERDAALAEAQTSIFEEV